VLRVGLTGGIASGKTAVADRLAALGAVVIDADVLARQVVDVGTSGLAEVVDAFGPAVRGADGALDRPAMARLVFSDEPARRRLEAIIHPLVREAARRLEAEASDHDPDAVVVHVIPLLVETGQVDAYDVVVVVDVDVDTQIARLVAERGMDPREARGRIDAQASREARLAAADEVIHNTRSLADLQDQVDALWQRLAT
jgi:dephospho-CoA kinase